MFDRHLAASADLPAGPRPRAVARGRRRRRPAWSARPRRPSWPALARRTEATLIAGVIEDEGDDRFHNWAVVYDPDGRGDRPLREGRAGARSASGCRSAACWSRSPATPSRPGTPPSARTPAVVDTPAGRLGVSISWEIFFGERARDAVNHGAELLLNPTNGSSFTGTQVQTQQVANSRMRAIENGRWVAPDRAHRLQRRGHPRRRGPAADVGLRASGPLRHRRAPDRPDDLHPGRRLRWRSSSPAIALGERGWLVEPTRAGGPQTSMITVAGPSLTSSTAMSVRNRPVATVTPSAAQLGDDRVDQRLGVLGPGRGQPRRPVALAVSP